MSNGIVDQYISQASFDGNILEDDFDTQLLGSNQDRHSKGRGQSSNEGNAGTVDIKNDVGALLSEAFKHASKQGEQEDAMRDAVKMTSHGVRVLGTLYTSMVKHVDCSDEIEINDFMQLVLKAVRDDTFKITRACGFDDGDVPLWLQSQISGQVMGLITSAIERNNGSFQSARKDQYLEPLIDAIKNESAGEISATFYTNPSNPDLQLTNALMMATAAVMIEHQAFSYFYSDPKPVARQVSGILKARVVDETLAELTVDWKLTAIERAYIGTTLLNHAGNIMAACWEGNKDAVVKYVKALDKADRQAIIVSGYPLDAVFESFDNFYGGLEVSAQASLEYLRSDARKQNNLAAENNK